MAKGKKEMRPKVYRAKQIAQLGCINESTVWRYVKEGKLTPHKVTNRVTVFKADEVHRFFGIDDKEVA